jgi:hypothetical protein
MYCCAPRSTEWFDGVDLDGEAASGSGAASPLPPAGGGGTAAARGGSVAALDPGPDAAQSGLPGSADASNDVPGIDLLVLRGGGATGADPEPGRSPDRSGAGTPATGDAAPDAAEASAGRGESGVSPGVSAAAGSAEAGGGAHVRVTVAAGPGERRVDVSTTPVAVHVYLEARFASLIACVAIVRCRQE